MIRVAIVLSALTLASLVTGCEKKEACPGGVCPVGTPSTVAPAPGVVAPPVTTPAPGVQRYIAPTTQPAAYSPCPNGYCPPLDTGLVVPQDQPLYFRSTTQPEERRLTPAIPPSTRQPMERRTPTTQRESNGFYD